MDRSACGDADDPWADVDEVLQTGREWPPFEAKGNSTILSIRGALTETSGEVMPSKSQVGLQGES